MAMRTACPTPKYPGRGTTAVQARPLGRALPRRYPRRMLSLPHWLLFLALATAVVYAGFVGGLALAGRRNDARALAGFIPDCIVLFRRLLGDSRLPRRR